MSKWNLRSGRKPTGGKMSRTGKKTRSDRRREPLFTRLGETENKIRRSVGGHFNRILLASNAANVTDPATGKTKKVKILSVIENPANPHFIRRNVITKGATIDTEIGRAKVTSRPSRDGAVNAVLLELKK